MIIIITGAPATGKTSIAEKTGRILGIDLISKDDFKAELFEKYGFTNHEEKMKLSIQGEENFYKTIEHYVTRNIDLIVDNNFKHFIFIREIIEKASNIVDVKCVYCVANYEILAKRYNERICCGNRHLGLYTLNQYPVIDGVSKFHPKITKDDVERIEQGVQEHTFGQSVLEIKTDNIEADFDLLCNKVIEFIAYKER